MRWNAIIKALNASDAGKAVAEELMDVLGAQAKGTVESLIKASEDSAESAKAIAKLQDDLKKQTADAAELKTLREQKAAYETERRNTAIKTEFNKVAAANGVAAEALESAFKLADFSAVKVDEKGAVVIEKAMIEALVKANPILAKKDASPPPPATIVMPPPPGGKPGSGAETKIEGPIGMFMAALKQK